MVGWVRREESKFMLKKYVSGFWGKILLVLVILQNNKILGKYIVEIDFRQLDLIYGIFEFFFKGQKVLESKLSRKMKCINLY